MTKLILFCNDSILIGRELMRLFDSANISYLQASRLPIHRDVMHDFSNNNEPAVIYWVGMASIHLYLREDKLSTFVKMTISDTCSIHSEFTYDID
jgi:hypothetical protein